MVVPVLEAFLVVLELGVGLELEPISIVCVVLPRFQ